MKRVKNQIEGIEPFNLFVLQSCYYHQLIAGLASFGIPYEKFLMGMLSFPKENMQIEKKFLTSKEMEKLWGYKNRKCNLSLKGFLRSIDKHRPVLAGMDLYYLEERPGSYHKYHSTHWILVYGYDLEQGIFNIVEQNYADSYKYIKKTISIVNFLYANKMYHRPPLKRKKADHVLIKKKPKGNGEVEILEKLDSSIFEQSKKVSEKNLKILKEMILQDSEIIKGKSSNIIEYLKEMKYFYSIIKRTEIFADSQEKKLKLSFIIAAYSNLLSMFWKMSKKNDYEFAFRYKDNILNKINELVEAEQIIYDDIVEYYKCKLKKLN